MRNPFSLILMLCTAAALLLGACSPARSMPVPAALETATATTAPTVPGPTATVTPEPSPSPEPTATETVEPPATPTVDAPASIATTEPTATSASGRPRVTALENTNCRAAPGRLNTVKGYFLKGMTAEVYSKNYTEEWVLIPNPDVEKEFCWVWLGSQQLSGSLAGVEVILFEESK